MKNISDGATPDHFASVGRCDLVIADNRPATDRGEYPPSPMRANRSLANVTGEILSHMHTKPAVIFSRLISILRSMRTAPRRQIILFSAAQTSEVRDIFIPHPNKKTDVFLWGKTRLHSHIRTEMIPTVHAHLMALRRVVDQYQSGVEPPRAP